MSLLGVTAKSRRQFFLLQCPVSINGSHNFCSAYFIISPLGLLIYCQLWEHCHFEDFCLMEIVVYPLTDIVFYWWEENKAFRFKYFCCFASLWMSHLLHVIQFRKRAVASSCIFTEIQRKEVSLWYLASFAEYSKWKYSYSYWFIKTWNQNNPP